jgi:hypothetical protein
VDGLYFILLQSGSEAITIQLLRRKLDPLATTDKSAMALPEGLPLRELTVGDIASFYKNQDTYVRALKTTS